MKPAESGNTVKVHYTGTLDDGTVFDSSREHAPLEITIGNGQLIQGFDNAVVGMKVGDEKTVTILSQEAYGEHRNELLVQFDIAQFPEDVVPEVGLQLNLKNPEGQVVHAVITSVGADSVTLDANHPLAGKDLSFEIEMMEIQLETGP